MRFILLGAPGSGKGTQARFIIEKYCIPQISTGGILRDIVKSRCELGKQIKKIIDTGELVSDDLILTLVKERIAKEDCRNGFILDGFPRTILQADYMKKESINIDYVLEFYIPEELILERTVNRRIHIASGRIYHTKFNPPKVEGRDDITGEKLSFRRDDIENTVFRRLDVYRRMTVPLITYFQKESKIGNTKYVRIDGTKSISEIHQMLEKFLE